MVSQIKVNEIIKQSGSSITIGESGDTITLPSTATLTNFPDNTPAFHAYINSNQAVSNASKTKAQFDTESFDTDNAYDNSTNYRFTPQTSGKYFFYTQVRLDSASNDNNIDYVILDLQKNGSDVSSAMLDFRSDRDGRKFTVNCSMILDMNGSSDYVEVSGTISANVTTDLKFSGGSSKSYFGGYKLV